MTARVSEPGDADERLAIEQRRAQIAALVETHQFASVQDLARRFAVSVVTIRNDIEALARQHANIRRVRGGILGGQKPYAETPYEARARNHAEDKEAIAAAAVAMVADNDTVLLDVGTTAMALAEALAARRDLSNVTVLTYGLNIALALESGHPRIQTVVTGGTLRPLQHSLVEPMATLILERVRAGTLFLACNGIDAVFGVSTTNLPEAAIKQAMMGAAVRTVAIADGSKIGRVTLARICAAEDLDLILTAGPHDTAALAQIRDRGVEVRDVTA